MPNKLVITDPTKILTLANIISLGRALLAVPIIYTLRDPSLGTFTFLLILLATLSDALEIILIQIKGSATNPKIPTSDDNKRMKIAGKSCNAKKISHSRYTYKKGTEFYFLKGNKWKESSPEEIFA